MPWSRRERRRIAKIKRKQELKQKWDISFELVIAFEQCDHSIGARWFPFSRHYAIKTHSPPTSKVIEAKRTSEIILSRIFSLRLFFSLQSCFFCSCKGKIIPLNNFRHFARNARAHILKCVSSYRVARTMVTWPVGNSEDNQTTGPDDSYFVHGAFATHFTGTVCRIREVWSVLPFVAVSGRNWLSRRWIVAPSSNGLHQLTEISLCLSRCRPFLCWMLIC